MEQGYQEKTWDCTTCKDKCTVTTVVGGDAKPKICIFEMRTNFKWTEVPKPVVVEHEYVNETL
jgi:hypothetical protein